MESFRTEEKLQLILVNQKFVQKEGARSYFVVLSLWKDLIHNDFKDKPTLHQDLTDLIEVNKLYNRTVVITFHQPTFNTENWRVK